MQLSKIKKICKAAGGILIVDTPSSQQWLGTGAALYPVGGMVYDPKNIVFVFDLQEKEVSGMQIRQTAMDDDRITIDTMPGGRERHLTRLPFTVGLAGDVWQPLSCGTAGVLFVNWEYLKPVMAKDGQLEFYLREAPGKMPMIAVVSGLLACAIVMPMGKDSAEELQGHMEELGQISAFDTSAKREV